MGAGVDQVLSRTFAIAQQPENEPAFDIEFVFGQCG